MAHSAHSSPPHKLSARKSFGNAKRTPPCHAESIGKPDDFFFCVYERRTMRACIVLVAFRFVCGGRFTFVYTTRAEFTKNENSKRKNYPGQQLLNKHCTDCVIRITLRASDRGKGEKNNQNGKNRHCHMQTSCLLLHGARQITKEGKK